jgi:hypothetical protein
MVRNSTVVLYVRMAGREEGGEGRKGMEGMEGGDGGREKEVVGDGEEGERGRWREMEGGGEGMEGMKEEEVFLNNNSLTKIGNYRSRSDSIDLLHKTFGVFEIRERLEHRG